MQRFPDRLAVSVRRADATERFTYRDLDELAVRAAAWLAGAGVRAGDRCAILAENGARWCAAYLGILKLGAVAVPLDTAYTAAQAGALIRDCRAAVLLASARHEAAGRGAAACAGGCFASIEALAAAPLPGSGLPDSPARPDDPAVILYTSGTTADPKGVVLTHANLLAEREGAFSMVPVSEQDTVLGVLPLFHALAQMANLLLPLSAGAHVVFLDALGTRDLLKALEEERISLFVCVPQFFYLIHQRMLDEVSRRGWVARTAFRALLRMNGAARRAGANAGPWLFARMHRTLGPRMRLLITGGSKFDERIGQDLYGLGFTILQAYGLTETSGAAAVTRPGEPIHTVGRPLPGVEIVLARPAAAGGAAPVGEEASPEAPADGEILIRGPIVMRGYWDRPDATADALRDGWLHTGDLGRLDSHGRLIVTGRSKEVIVLGSGKNIHPDDVEAHYRQSPFIRELCVVGLTTPGAPHAERLHAVVVPDTQVLRERRIVNTRELIRFELEGLAVALPPHQRVLGFDVVMEPLPRTTTGKLKRHEILRRYAGAPGSPGQEGVASESAAETAASDPVAAAIVARVQHLVRPGAVVRADSNLELDLGLDSMERVELLASLERQFGTRIDDEAARSLFTLRDLVEVFRGARGSEAAPAEAAWAKLLDPANTAPELRALLRPRPLAAPLLFLIARCLSSLLARRGVAGIEHLPGRGPFIIGPNHQSYLDPVAVLGVLPFGVFRRLFFVGAAEYFQTPFTAWLARMLNVVPVDSDANLVPAMQAGAFGLRHGRVLVLFPEGERSIDGRVKTFRKGAAILSRHIEVPIVPVAIDGMFELWPRRRPLDWRRLLPWSGHHVRVQFGPPVEAGSASYAEQTALLRSRVEEMWLALHAAGATKATKM